MSPLESKSLEQQASELLHWALDPRTKPVQHEEYRRLVDRYIEDREFRRVVDDFATGQKLDIVDVSSKGVALVPEPGSRFASKPGNYRRSGSADKRLLDGLALYGILATFYPRASDLEGPRDEAPRPVTVEEVDQNIRRLAEQWEERAREENRADPTVEELEQGLEEAWRVYHNRVETGKAETNGSSPRATRSYIEHAFEYLRQNGLIQRVGRSSPPRFQPTWALNAVIQTKGAARVYRATREAMSGSSGSGPSVASSPSS